MNGLHTHKWTLHVSYKSLHVHSCTSPVYNLSANHVDLHVYIHINKQERISTVKWYNRAAMLIVQHTHVYVQCTCDTKGTCLYTRNYTGDMQGTCTNLNITWIHTSNLISTKVSQRWSDRYLWHGVQTLVAELSWNIGLSYSRVMGVCMDTIKVIDTFSCIPYNCHTEMSINWPNTCNNRHCNYEEPYLRISGERNH